MVRLNNITKTFKSDNGIFKALDDVSIEVFDNDIIGIVGSSGAGKSTLVRCINLLERPDSGEVFIDDSDLMLMDNKKLANQRSSIGMIFQHFNLMSQRNVYKNISFPLEKKGLSKSEIRARVTSLLELVGISDKEKAYPSELSGGQKQRVAIARALADNPKLLLCDEATSALDPETTKSILNLLREINAKLNLCIIIITHQKEVVKEICKNLIVLEKGRVVEKGKTIDIFTSPKTAAAKSFVGNILEDPHIIDTLNNLKFSDTENKKLYKLTFLGDDSSEPFISQISKRFNVLVSILFGNIDIIQGETVGILIVKITGNDFEIEECEKYLLQNEILVEKI